MDFKWKSNVNLATGRSRRGWMIGSNSVRSSGNLNPIDVRVWMKWKGEAMHLNGPPSYSTTKRGGRQIFENRLPGNLVLLFSRSFLQVFCLLNCNRMIQSSSFTFHLIISAAGRLLGGLWRGSACATSKIVSEFLNACGWFSTEFYSTSPGMNTKWWQKNGNSLYWPIRLLLFALDQLYQ